MRKTIVPGGLLLLGVLLHVGGQTVGQISYTEGDVQITRNGALLADAIAPGFPLEDLDLIRTGDDGLVEITTDPETGVDSTITVQNDTVFSLDLADLAAPAAHNLELLSGTLSLSVKTLASSQNLDVNTDTATMGIRGTVFEVTEIPSGEALLSVSEGRVSCTTAAGAVLYGEPGQAVEDDAAAGWRNRPVSADGVASFRTQWRENHLANLRLHATDVLRRNANEYLTERSRFDAAYQSLAERGDIVAKWIREEQGHSPLVLRDYRVERRQVASRLFAAHRELIRFEHVYFRIQRLEELYRQGVAFGEVQPGLSAQAFFAQLDNDRATIDNRVRQLPYLVKIDRERFRVSRLPASEYVAPQ